MQYHLNGFKAGDPDVHPAAPGHRRAGDPLPETVDVLIAGSGPAGLCLAAQLAGVPQIRTLLVEPKLGPMEKGQADGISVRSMEMFQAFGFAEKVKREAVWINETTFWAPGADAALARVARVQDVPDGTSEMPHVLINQARVHDMFLDIMRNSPSRLEPDYGLKVAGLVVDPGAAEYPVTVALEHTAPGREGQTATVRANYVIGCDGARSAVRSAIGGALHGDAAHQAWGVMDLLAVTDFPDWRMKSFVRSLDEGILMVLPREGGHLVRLYVELDNLGEHERAADRGMGAEDIIAKARRIFSPFQLDVKEVVWWSIYEIGHRLTDKFDDVPEGEVATRAPRVMLAGDACHTHSPKAGQGMNVSMGDTFNLGWKLISVLTGRADPALLHSYSGERRAAAKGLVEFDHQWARVVGGLAEDDASDGLPRVAREFVNNLPFTCGLTIQYEAGALTGAAVHQHLATGFAYRQALPFRPRRPPGRRQAHAAGPLHRGRRALPPVPVRAGGRCRRPRWRRRPAVRLARARCGLAAAPPHRAGAGRGCRDRHPRGLPAGLPRARLRHHAHAAASARGPLRAVRLREGLLCRPGARRRPVRRARHRPGRRLHRHRAPGPVRGPCAPAAGPRRTGGVFRRHPAGARLTGQRIALSGHEAGAGVRAGRGSNQGYR